MKFFGVLLFTLNALDFTRCGAEDVCEGMAKACIDNLLTSLLGDTSEAEVCGEIRHAISCLEDVADKCLGEEETEELKDGITELRNLMHENCGNGVVRQTPVLAQRQEQKELEQISECFVHNKDHVLHQCMYKSSGEAMSILSSDASADLIKCAIFGMMASCFVEKVGERCGDKASKIANEELTTLPLEITNACEAAGGIDVYSFQFHDNKRKK